MKIIKAFGRFVAKFPFAGKVVIRPAYRSFRNAGDEERPARFVILSKLLAFMVGGHAIQARMGFTAIKLMMVRKVHAFWMTVFVGYTVANVAVTIAQATLLVWSFHAYFVEKQVEPGKPVEGFTSRELATMFAVTLGGQILFVIGSTMYK